MVTAGIWANIDIKNDQGETCLYLEDVWVEAEYEGAPGALEMHSIIRIRFETPSPSRRLVAAPKWLEEKLLKAVEGDEKILARLDEKALEETYATE